MSEDPGDILRVRPRTPLIDPLPPVLAAETYEVARALVPGADVYALEADWQAFWGWTGRKRLRAPDKAFLGWLRQKMDRG